MKDKVSKMSYVTKITTGKMGTKGIKACYPSGGGKRSMPKKSKY